jgi:hypothetical protein
LKGTPRTAPVFVKLPYCMVYGLFLAMTNPLTILVPFQDFTNK